MTFSMRRVSAIVRKEMQDAGKNSQVLMMAALPVVFALIYGQMNGPKEGIASLTILTALIFIGGFVQAMVIAEEKEKHTLRVLMLSPASSLDVLLGKGFITAVLTIVASFANLFILNVFKGNMVVFVLLIVISTLIFIMLGTIIGLFSETVAQTSLIGMPILMVLFMGPMMLPYIKNETIKTIIEFLPTYHIGEAIVKLLNGKGFVAVNGDFINLGIWFVVAVIVCLFTYKKKQLD
ncbi:ABC transporter permease [Bacillus clarus]|uniref:ABC transporter permease n=1 Tax=Bacillus clarus TaxID=2338372 RepID=A0A090YM24_9BACI|nr:ABC transporter permease [Bacillus clarus]KFM99499.1 ABC-2 type transporter family protein [Bacillus clarus]RFT67517.1 ABC transporter permease [Bacillus clarus]